MKTLSLTKRRVFGSSGTCRSVGQRCFRVSDRPPPPQTFLNTSSCPEVQGFLHVKELGRKSWKKLYMCLRRSGLYCSTKGSSKVGEQPPRGHTHAGVQGATRCSTPQTPPSSGQLVGLTV